MKLGLQVVALHLLQSVTLCVPILETHELSSLLSSAAPPYLLEILPFAHTPQARIPSALVLPLQSFLDAEKLPLVKSPRAEVFVEEMMKVGIHTDDRWVVLYDSVGIRAAAVAWWTMEVFGRGNVAVLNGGLPKWEREGYPTVTDPLPPALDPALEDASLYNYVFNSSKLWKSEDLYQFQSEVSDPAMVQVVDVRPRGDFERCSIPGSVNLPLDILTSADDTVRSAIELRQIFDSYHVTQSDSSLTVVLSTDGSDSAAVLLALRTVNKANCANVDGGWREYEAWGHPQQTEEPSFCPPEVPEDTPGEPLPEPAVQAVHVSAMHSGDVLSSEPSPAPSQWSALDCESACAALCADTQDQGKCSHRCVASFCTCRHWLLYAAATALLILLLKRTQVGKSRLAEPLLR